jgi:ubiquinone/menaquinone biosynthesis C-methylase UbiE
MKEETTKPEPTVENFYGLGGIMEKIEAGLKLSAKDIRSLTIDDLAPVDGFHTRGREATREVAELTVIKPSDLVLDVGCGLGGTVRYLADRYRCQVAGIDLTDEYISVGKKLTEMVGLSDLVEHRHGSALEIPYENERFDIVWTDHVQMNIADKHHFYSEMARVLKPNGRLLFHDVFRGPGDPPLYPTPWAEDESISVLVTERQGRLIMEKAGMRIDQWCVKVQESIDFFQRVLARIDAKGQPPIGIHILMGDDTKVKIQNYLRNLSEDRVSIALGLAHKDSNVNSPEVKNSKKSSNHESTKGRKHQK